MVGLGWVVGGGLGGEVVSDFGWMPYFMIIHFGRECGVFRGNFKRP